LIGLLQIVFGTIYVFKVPLWAPSDERAHMSYIVAVAHTGNLPVIGEDHATYEAHQPPLFYVVAAGAYKIFESRGWQFSGYCLRTLCFVLHLAAFTIAILIYRQYLSRHREILLASVSLFAFDPSLLAFCCAISNDSLAFLIATIWGYLLCRNRFEVSSARHALLIGFVVGLGLLCKLTFAPFLVLSLLYSFRPGKVKQSLANCVCMILVVSVMLAPWIWHNWLVYGAATAQARVIDISPPAGDLFHLNWKSLLAYHFVPSEFWMNEVKVPLWLQIGLVVAALIGVLGLFRSFYSLGAWNHEERKFVLFCLATYSINLAAWLWTALFVQQGAVRWVFGSFFALAVVFSLGLLAWFQNCSERLRLTLGASIVLGLVALNIYIIVAWVPNLVNLFKYP